MKKTILSIVLAASLSIFAVAQTKYISPSKDTLIINTTVPTPVPVTTVVFKAYKPPVTTPPVASTGTTQTVMAGGTVSGPVTLQSNNTYSGLTIDLGATSGIAFNGSGVSNVIISNCKILNGALGIAILLNSCSNVTIDHCFISGCGQGILAKSSTGTKITNNQFLNIVGSPAATWHPVQLQNCNGGGQRILNNHIEEIASVAPYTHDQISIYNSNGIPGDSIMVVGNWIRGGQQVKNAAGNNGACAIGVGDSGGSYQVVRNNTLVNALAIAIDGAGTSLKVDHNKIYARQTAPQPLSVGIVYFGNPGNNFVGYNQINFIGPNGKANNLNPAASTSIQGWNTNIVNAKIDDTILPTNMITIK